MRILYLHQYFATHKGSTGTRSYEFARYLVGKGHDVTMLTSGLANKEFAVPQGKEYIEAKVDGIDIVAIAAAYNDPHVGTGMSGSLRMFKFFQFARMASRVGKKLPKPDIVFATHTPLTIGLAGISLARHFNAPFVFEVRDLWPEALINIGALKNPFVIWWLSRMAKKIYAGANHIIALSPGMKEGIIRTGAAADKVTVIPNVCNLDLFDPDLDGSISRQRLGLTDKFTAIYFGAMGHANGLEYVIEAARILNRRGSDHIAIVLLGDGGKRKELEKLTQEYKLTNVIFSDPTANKNELARTIAGCQVCLTIFRAAREHTWSPNKMFDALAAGKPVLINVPGWLGETIEGNNCGRYIDPHRPEMLANTLEELAANPQLCSTMSQNAHALAKRQFDKDKLAGQFKNVLLDVIRQAQ